MESPEVILHLLDGSQSHPIQTWKFKGQEIIRVGRLDENEVIIRQQNVSRLHAVVKWEGGHWMLSNQSRLGTLVDGFPIEQSNLSEGERFQLGPMGPVLSIHSQAMRSNDCLGTVSSSSLPHGINLAKKEEQVEEIAKSDYFKNLQQMAKKLKASGGN